MRTNVYAFTASGTEVYPEFVSVNAEENGLISITIRPRMQEDATRCPETAVVYLNKKQVSDLAISISKYDSGDSVMETKISNKVVLSVYLWKTNPQYVLREIQNKVDEVLEEQSTGTFTATIMITKDEVTE